MIKDLLILPEKTIFPYIENHLDIRGYQGDDFLFYDNKSPICLVSHIDTVMPKKQKIDLLVNNFTITNRHGVLGADDRAGVYAMLKLYDICKISKTPLPSMLFTSGEECGGVGAYEFCSSITKTDTEKINIFIELDRKGSNEYVYYSDTLPKKVVKYIESYGFFKNFGSFSDISILTEKTLIPSVNLSIGYYNQHTPKESLHLDETHLTIRRVFEMLKNPIAKRHAIPKKTYTSWYGNKTSYYGPLWKSTCEFCGMENAILTVYDNVLMCPECIDWEKQRNTKYGIGV